MGALVQSCAVVCFEPGSHELINGVAEPELDNLIHTYTSRSLVMAQPWDQHSQQLEQFLQLEFQRWKEGISSAEPRREVPSWEGEMEKLKANSE